MDQSKQSKNLERRSKSVDVVRLNGSQNQHG